MNGSFPLGALNGYVHSTLYEAAVARKYVSIFWQKPDSLGLSVGFSKPKRTIGLWGAESAGLGLIDMAGLVLVDMGTYNTIGIPKDRPLNASGSAIAGPPFPSHRKSADLWQVESYFLGLDWCRKRES